MKVLLFEAQDDSSRSQDALADEPEIAVDILNAAADITVTFATSVIEESDRTSIDPSDVILIDISQSNTNGLDFLAEIKRAIPRIPIVVLADQEHQRKALQAIRTGAQDFLLMGRASGASIVRALSLHPRYRFRSGAGLHLYVVPARGYLGNSFISREGYGLAYPLPFSYLTLLHESPQRGG